MTKVNEEKRIYFFPDGDEIEILDIIDVNVSESGGHRISCKDKGMVYVAPKWLAVEIFSEDGWVF